MKKLLIAIAGFAVIGLGSCGEICVRCENGVTADQETECFTKKNERDEYVRSREFMGYTCNDN